MPVVYLNRDQFKLVNSAFGHGVGNQLLLAIAERLQQLLWLRPTASTVVGKVVGKVIDRAASAPHRHNFTDLQGLRAGGGYSMARCGQPAYRPRWICLRAL
ncbi:MAG: diguanylate cyclase [Nodosilinea sp.]